MKTVLFIVKNESSKCCLTYCENRMSKSFLVLEILPGIYSILLFSTEGGAVDSKCWVRIRLGRDLKIRPNDFLDFWHEVGY